MASQLAHIASDIESRRALAGGIAFLEGSASPAWSFAEVCAWFDQHIVLAGWMATPVVITEPSAGTLPLHASPTSAPLLREIIAAARRRVLTALRGLTASPVDDRFLAAMIFNGHVTRRSELGQARWVPTPPATTPLSGIVLSLFAVDVLSHRANYSDYFADCDTCDSLTFHGPGRACLEHATQTSGMFRKVDRRESPS